MPTPLELTCYFLLSICFTIIVGLFITRDWKIKDDVKKDINRTFKFN